MDLSATLLATAALFAAPSPSTLPSATPPLTPLAGEWLEELGDAGFASPPTGSVEPRPVVVAVHGRGDRPEWECAAWRAVFGPRPFIVCPRGTAWQVNFAWTSWHEVERAIDAVIDAADRRYGAHLDRAHRIYAGFSQGAIFGPRILQAAPSVYPYAVFQEGYDDALAGAALPRTLQQAGLTRVILGCSQGGCAGKRVPVRAALARAGVEAHVNDAGPRGHTIDEVVIESLRKDVGWLVGSDPIWGPILEPAPTSK